MNSLADVHIVRVCRADRQGPDAETLSVLTMCGGPSPASLNANLVLAKDMQDALTAATLVFGDGARQTFTADGKTTYVEHGGSTQGEWSIVQDGEFSSFWPPDYRATYVIRWIVEEGAVKG